jgi:hypothetical protein
MTPPPVIEITLLAGEAGVDTGVLPAPVLVCNVLWGDLTGTAGAVNVLVGIGIIESIVSNV